MPIKNSSIILLFWAWIISFKICVVEAPTNVSLRSLTQRNRSRTCVKKSMTRRSLMQTKEISTWYLVQEERSKYGKEESDSQIFKMSQYRFRKICWKESPPCCCKIPPWPSRQVFKSTKNTEDFGKTPILVIKDFPKKIYNTVVIIIEN